MESSNSLTARESLHFEKGETLMVEITLMNVSPELRKSGCSFSFLDDLYKKAKDSILLRNL